MFIYKFFAAYENDEVISGCGFIHLLNKFFTTSLRHNFIYHHNL